MSKPKSMTDIDNLKTKDTEITTNKADKTYVDTQDTNLQNQITVLQGGISRSAVSNPSTPTTLVNLIISLNKWEYFFTANKVDWNNITDVPVKSTYYYVKMSRYGGYMVVECGSLENKNEIYTCNISEGVATGWQQLATTSISVMPSLPFVSGVIDNSKYGQRTHYIKNCFGYVDVFCDCLFSNTTPIENSLGILIATMPNGYIPSFSSHGSGTVIVGENYNTTDTNSVSVTITNTGEIRMSGLNKTGTNNVLRFHIGYYTK